MDGLGTQPPLNPRQQVEARIADLDQRINKLQAKLEAAHEAGDEGTFGDLEKKIYSLRIQRTQWQGWMRSNAWRHPKTEVSA